MRLGKKEKAVERTWTKIMKGFSCSYFCVYIGHRRLYRKNKNPKALSTDHSPIF